MKPYGDLNLRLPALTAFLYAMGGWGMRTIIRRIGTPLSVVVFAALKHGIKGWDKLIIYAATFGLGFAVMTLPVSLIGDSIPGHFMNWIWLWVLGGLAGLSLAPMIFLIENKIFFESMTEFEDNAIKFVYGCIICFLVWGASLTATNLLPWFEHAWAEILCGLSYGFAAAMIIGKK